MEHIDLNDEGTKAFDAVNAWIADAKAGEYGFIRAAHVAFTQFHKGNRDPLAKLLTVASGKKAKRIRLVEGNKLVYLAPLKRLCQHILPHVKAKYNAGSDFGVAWTVDKSANTPVNEAALDTLSQYASLDRDEAISPFSKTFKEAFPAIKSEAPAKTEEMKRAEAQAKVAKFVEKMAEEYGFGPFVLKHMIDAKTQNEEPAH